MENNELEQISLEPLKDIDVRLTEDEIYTCLKKTFHRSEKTSWVESAVLLIVFVYSLIGFITDANHAFSSIGVAISALLILAALWLVPIWHSRNSAKKLMENEPVMKLKIYEDRLVFGDENSVTIGYNEYQPVLCGNLIILSIGTQMIGIPRRLTGEDGWNLLLQKFQLDK